MSIDLEEIEVAVSESSNVFKLIFLEVCRFMAAFIVVFVIWVTFLNGQLIFQIIDELFFENKSMASNVHQINSDESQNMEISLKESFWNEMLHDLQKREKIKRIDNHLIKLKSQIIEELIDDKLNTLKYVNKNDGIYKPWYEHFVKDKLLDYKLSFNLLPPDKRLVIEKLWINVHIVDIIVAPYDKIENADYNEELFSGVVKYPYTPEPDEEGNMMIFGHTSFYWWKKNPYGTIFSKLPVLEKWDEIQVIWKWKLYKYSVIEKVIKRPRDVLEYYNKFKSGQFITLMWCYPIWSDAKRLLVIWELIEE